MKALFLQLIILVILIKKKDKFYNIPLFVGWKWKLEREVGRKEAKFVPRKASRGLEEAS